MQITFQNKQEDYEAFYDYMLKQTKEGERFGKYEFNRVLGILFDLVIIFFAVLWAITANLKLSGLILLGILILVEGVILLVSRPKLYYFFGRRVYKHQEKLIEPKDAQVFLLQKTVLIDDDYLEIRNTEVSHRYRWRRVDHIGLTSNFIFIHVGVCPVVYVPKRDFPSEEAFLELGKKLIQSQEGAKNQPIGIE